MEGLFDTGIALLHKSLDFRTQRHNVLASNIANLETPLYKAQDLIFEQALGRAMKAHKPGPLRTTHPRHMDGRNIIPLDRVQAQTIRTGNPVGSLDGNTVDLEREMAKLAENQITYQALARMMSHKFLTLREVIREGEQ